MPADTKVLHNAVIHVFTNQLPPTFRKINGSKNLDSCEVAYNITLADTREQLQILWTLI